jgi:hypothetical protein
LSKLAEKMKSVTRLASAPLGFGTARASTEPTMVLAGIARDAKEARELAGRGADVVVLAGSKPEAGRELEGVIVGAIIPGKVDDEARAYREGGFDFVVFDPNAALATALLDETVGYVMILPKDADEADLRTLDAFQLDAVDVGAVDGSLTVRRQIELRRISALTRKPLMARIRGDVSSRELQALRDTSVVIVAADKAEDVQKLRATIDGLPPRARRRDGDDRLTPLVPRAAAVDTDGEDDD